MNLTYLVPIYNPEISQLIDLITSFNQQTSKKFKVVFVDDASEISGLSEIIKKNAIFEQEFIRLDENQGISGALNQGLRHVSGKYVAFVDQDDFLEHNCTKDLLETSKKHPKEVWFYSDEYLWDSKRDTKFHLRKNSFNSVELHSSMYINHIQMFKKSELSSELFFRSQFDGSQDHELAIRLDKLGFTAFHISKPLYRWRMNNDSFSRKRFGTGINRQCLNASVMALNEHVSKKESNANFKEIGKNGIYQLQVTENTTKKVSIIVPTAARKISGGQITFLERCLKSLLLVTSQIALQSMEFIFVCSDYHGKVIVQDVLNKLNIDGEIVIQSGDFNFSRKVNKGISKSNFEYVTLLNDDIIFQTTNPIHKLIEFMDFYQLDVAGPLVLDQQGKIQSAGDRVEAGIAYHIGEGLNPLKGLGQRVAQLSREVSSVTGAILLTRRSSLRKVGGFDLRFPSAYQDVVFCAKVKRVGGKIGVFPSVKVIHSEGVSRGKEVTEEEIRKLRMVLKKEFKEMDPLGFHSWNPSSTVKISYVISKLWTTFKRIAPGLLEEFFYSIILKIRTKNNRRIVK
jgi:GT2 family glycosyltransferase